MSDLTKYEMTVKVRHPYHITREEDRHYIICCETVPDKAGIGLFYYNPIFSPNNTQHSHIGCYNNPNTYDKFNS